MRKSLLLLSLVAVFSVRAQIETDRPDFTESPNVVPVGAIQLETGFVYAVSKQQYACTDESIKDITLNTGLLRYGLSEHTELRLNWSVNRLNAHVTNGGDGTHICPQVLINSETITTGLSPIFIGIKHNIHSSENVSIGFLAHMYLPFTGTTGFEASRFAPEFLLPISFGVTEKLSISVQLGMSWDGQSVSPAGTYTLSIAYGLTDRLGVYVEPYGYKNNTHVIGRLDSRINGGFTFLVNDNFQLDVSGGLFKGETSTLANRFIGCGLSYIYQK